MSNNEEVEKQAIPSRNDIDQAMANYNVDCCKHQSSSAGNSYGQEPAFAFNYPANCGPGFNYPMTYPANCGPGVNYPMNYPVNCGPGYNYPMNYPVNCGPGVNYPMNFPANYGPGFNYPMVNGVGCGYPEGYNMGMNSTIGYPPNQQSIYSQLLLYFQYIKRWFQFLLSFWPVYTNRDYHVTFRYPPYWQKVDELRYEGPHGFFQISAISSTEPIDRVCQKEAAHQLKPYGSGPIIRPVSIQGQQACYIFPSADQPAEMKDQAALIIVYPQPVVISGESYNYFVLWADKDYIKLIGNTVQFFY